MKRRSAWPIVSVAFGAVAGWFVWQRVWPSSERAARRIMRARGAGFRDDDLRGSDVDGDVVENASAESFPASDPPSWSAR